MTSGAPRRKNLVYTSAGDRSAVRNWLSPQRNFDLWVTYYGDQTGSYREIADHYHERKGSKFQNLHHAYLQSPEVFAPYDYVLVMDDDVIIEADAIDRLFALSRALDLWVCQPAFSRRGKISWPITKAHPSCRYRFTNFVEMTCPLFRQDKLAAFMQVYDPVLVGFGMDWWFLNTMRPDLRGRVAVIDEIMCINPHDRAKGGGREIDRLQSVDMRRAVWGEVKKKYGIFEDENGMVEYSRVRKKGAHAVFDVLTYGLTTAPAMGTRIAAGLLRRAKQQWLPLGSYR